MKKQNAHADVPGNVLDRCVEGVLERIQETHLHFAKEKCTLHKLCEQVFQKLLEKKCPLAVAINVTQPQESDVESFVEVLVDSFLDSFGLETPPVKKHAPLGGCHGHEGEESRQFADVLCSCVSKLCFLYERGLPHLLRTMEKEQASHFEMGYLRHQIKLALTDGSILALGDVTLRSQFEKACDALLKYICIFAAADLSCNHQSDKNSLVENEVVDFLEPSCSQVLLDSLVKSAVGLFGQVAFTSDDVHDLHKKLSSDRNTILVCIHNLVQKNCLPKQDASKIMKSEDDSTNLQHDSARSLPDDKLGQTWESPEEVENISIRQRQNESFGSDSDRKAADSDCSVVEEDDEEDVTDAAKMLRSRGSSKRRISFASDDGLVSVREFMPYSDVEKRNLFYTSEEITSFLLEAQDEEDQQGQFESCNTDDQGGSELPNQSPFL